MTSGKISNVNSAPITSTENDWSGRVGRSTSTTAKTNGYVPGTVRTVLVYLSRVMRAVGVIPL